MPIFIVFIYLISVYVCMCMRVRVCHDTCGRQDSLLEPGLLFYHEGPRNQDQAITVGSKHLQKLSLPADTYRVCAHWKGRELTQRASESEVFAVSGEN